MLNFHQSLPFLNWLFPLLHFPQEFLTRFSCKNFPQQFPTKISHKIFPQQFPARFSRNNFPQDFPTTISCKIFPKQFPARFSRKIFPGWILIGWLPITLFQMINFHQSLSFLNWLFPLLHFPQQFPARISRKNFPQDFPARISRKNFPQDFPTTISRKIFPQQFPARFSHKIFPQDFPELDTDWLAPHHPIPNAKFPPITVFLKLAFSPPPFPTRISRNNFLQEFPARFSHNNFPQDFLELDTDWLAPHHPFPNAKFPPITASGVFA